MLLVVVPLSLELQFVLSLWLNKVPEGALIVCYLTLLSALVRVVVGGATSLIQASGKIKWFQIVGSIIELLCLPVSFCLFKLDFPFYSVIIVFILSSIIVRITSFYQMAKILNFDVLSYILNVFPRPFFVISFLLVYGIIYLQIPISSFIFHFLGFFINIIITIVVILYIGRLGQEKNVDFLIDNQKHFVEKNKNAKLLIVGSGPDYDRYKEKAKELNLEENIILTGKVPYNEINYYSTIIQIAKKIILLILIKK